MNRGWAHPDTQIDVTVVNRGVDLSLTQLGKTIVCELTQDGAIELAHAIMWRAGCRLIRHTKSGDIQFEFASPHPFEKTWAGPIDVPADEVIS